MKIKLLFTVIALSLICFCPAKSQTDTTKRDKYTLLTMPYNKRPLSLYRGQLQVNAGYMLAVRSRSFDNNGDVIDLKANGNSSARNYYSLDLKYGLLDFLEIDAATSYMHQGIRSESVYLLNSNGELLLNYLNEYKGMGDLFLSASCRLPFDIKFFDFMLTGGIYLPTAAYKPPEPSNTITDYADSYNYTINYHYNNKNGFGVPVYKVAADVKFFLSRFSVTAGFSFQDPTKEGTNIRWNESLTGQTFSYSSAPYQYLPDRTMMINASVHYQPAGWFNVWLKGNYTRNSEGWTEYLGTKYANPEEHLFAVEPGFEIQISPSLTLYQVAGYTFSGRNIDAPFYLITTIIFNLFPFLK
ncbi:MAG: hypothetical protein ABR974_09975 [Bacteroidales bacterium]|jgi:hypothetical protein